MNPLETILTSVLSSGAILGVIAWFARTWIGEHIRQSVQHEYAKLRTEHTVRFSRLHEEQANAIKELYARLVKAESAIQHAADPMREPESYPAGLQIAAESGNRFRNYFSENRILFSEELADLVDSIWLKLKEAYCGIEDWHDALDSPPPNRALGSPDRIAIARKILKTDLPVLKSKMETEFRQILGVPSRTIHLPSTP